MIFCGYFKTYVFIKIINFFFVSNRHSILKILPALRILNGDILNPQSDVHIEEHYYQDLGGFLALCQNQLEEFDLLTKKYITQKG